MKSEKQVEKELEKARRELLSAAQTTEYDDQDSLEEVFASGKDLGYLEGYEAALRRVLGEEE